MKDNETKNKRSQLSSNHQPYLDGGWGWVVMIASFLSQTMIGSIYFGYGVLLPEWMREFQSSSAITSFVGSTTAGAISASGPIASFLIVKFGCRVTHMIGGAAMSLALIGCFFATSMWLIFLLYSVCAGIGGGLCYIPAIITISEFFKEKRSIAVGVVASGIGFGSFVFPVVFEYLMELYGWRGAILLVGGINANMIVFGLIMCPVDKAPNFTLFSCFKKNKTESSSSVEVEVKCDQNANLLKSDKTLETKGSEISAIDVKDNQPKFQRKNSFQIMRAWLTNPLTRRKSSFALSSQTTSEEVQAENIESSDEVFKVSIPETIPEESQGVEISALLEPTIDIKKEANYLKQTKMLLKNPNIYILLINNVTVFCGMMIVFGLTPLRAYYDLNMTIKQGAILVSIMGLSNLMGRFLWGFVAAVKCVHTPTLFIALRIASGVLTILSPLATSFEWNAVYCGLVGAAFGHWSIYPVVVADQFGDGLLTVAFGYLEVGNGLGSVIGPLIGGYMYDVYQVYTYSFLLSGMFLLGGVFPLIISYTLKSCKKQRIHTPAI
uniref:monocarboxylate transporter 9-like n=1 Tax=Styela clava TaxID=7725 RepID=UPI001939BE2B|nr:monocarboxylate transporter 9-like [Styela clava]